MNYLYIFSFVLAIGLSFYVYGLKKGAWYFFITFFIILLGIIADDLLFPYTTIIAILILSISFYFYRKFFHLRKEITASEYDEKFKEVHKEEAKKLYPHKGRYVLKGTVLTYIGDV